MSFEIHPQLQKDCINLGSFELSRLLLMNDSNFPWFILVPARPEVSEIFQLSDADQILLIKESSHLARELRLEEMNHLPLTQSTPTQQPLTQVSLLPRSLLGPNPLSPMSKA